MRRFGSRRPFLRAAGFLLFLALALCPHAARAFTDGQNANDALGQLDGLDNPVFSTAAVNDAPNNRGLYGGFGVVVDTVSHRLFVSDGGNNRVVVYNLDSNNNLASRAMIHVLGQPDFRSNGPATTQNGLNSPAGLAYDAARQRLYVSEQVNMRVVVYDVSSISDGENAQYVLGEPNFTTVTQSATQSTMDRPIGIAYDPPNARLFVTDLYNSRILVYNVATLSNGPNAAHVLGETTFTNHVQALSQSGLNFPTGCAYDTSRQWLYVSDYFNNRVIVYDVSSITDGENAT